MTEAALIHTEDTYMLATTDMTQQEIIDRLKADGYSMGRSSLSNLMSGTAVKSCGFTFQPAANESVSSKEHEVMDNTKSVRILRATAPTIAHVKAALHAAKATAITEAGQEAVRKLDAIVNQKPVIKSRRQREGGFAGKDRLGNHRAGAYGVSLRADTRISKLDFHDGYPITVNNILHSYQVQA